MPSPFPGMDPFLEAHWGDVHTTLSTYIRNELRAQLPEGLKARIEESVILEAVDDDLAGENYGRIYPDVGVLESPTSRGSSASSLGGVAVSEPIITTTKFVPRTQRAVHIFDTNKKMRLVTAIELISPGNKIGSRNRDVFQTRQESILEAEASLVEIDFIRQGQQVLYCPPLGDKSPYGICVVRGWQPTRAEVYTARYDAALPTIRIPLRKRDPDAILELQKLLDRAYIDGDYEDLDYTRKLKPPFTAAENRWLKAQLKKRA